MEQILNLTKGKVLKKYGEPNRKETIGMVNGQGDPIILEDYIYSKEGLTITLTNDVVTAFKQRQDI